MSERLIAFPTLLASVSGASLVRNKEIALLCPLRMLRTGKVNHWRDCIVKIEKPGIARDAYDFKILKFGHESEANALPDGIAQGESRSARLPLTMATRGWCSSSAQSKSRPRTRLIPSVRIKSGETIASFAIMPAPGLEASAIVETVSASRAPHRWKRPRSQLNSRPVSSRSAR